MNPDIYLHAYQFFGVFFFAGIALGILTSSDTTAGLLSFLSLFGLLVTAIHQMFGIMAFIAIPAGLIVLSFIGNGYGLILDKRNDILRKRAERMFPLASHFELNLIAARLKKGQDVSELRWDGHRVIRGQGDSVEKLTRRGWGPLIDPAAPYPYLEEQKILEAALSPLGVLLAPEMNHFLCSMLYFNWNIGNLVVEDNLLLVTMKRREETRIDRIPYSSQPTPI